MAGELAGGRVAELTTAFSLAVDLGTGQPMEQGLRTCWLSVRAADALGLDDATRSDVFYVALLRFLGCTADAAETAVLAGGDDLAYNAAMAPALAAGNGEGTRWLVHHLAEGLPAGRRVGRVAAALADPGRFGRSLRGHCEVASRLAVRLGMSDGVVHGLAHAYERWDGKGYPAGLGGEAVPIAVRVVGVARDTELWERRAGWPAAAAALDRRRGRAHDPAVVDALLSGGPGWLRELDGDPLAQVLEAEPHPVLMVGEGGLDAALAAMADFTDLKSPAFRTHSSGVASLVGAAASAAGLSDADAIALSRAGLVHDVGRVGVPNGIWDRPGPLTASDWERVRLHPYLTERILRRSAVLATFADVAGRHHERVDGSGYHRGESAEQLSLSASLLAAADAYHAMTEARPYRPALGPAEATTQLLELVEGEQLAAGAVDAVLAAAGQARRPVSVPRPAGLTEREVDVLRLIARGQANKRVAATLGISPKTVGHHVEHIYAKAGVTTRAGATLFAMEHGLLSP